MCYKQLIISILTVSLFCDGYADTSVPSINDLMSIEDQNKTGVIRLTQNQKMELAKWLVAHGYYQDEKNYEVLSGPKVALNVYDGKIIQLSDNSVWEISPEDRKTSQSWLSSIPIQVTKASDTKWPYILTNLLTNESVKAKPSVL